MHLRILLPLFFSVAGVFTILVPLISFPDSDQTSIPDASGANIYSYELNGQAIENTHLSAAIVHEDNLFHLTLWLQPDRQDRVTFVLKDSEITEGAYALDDQNNRYLSFEFHSLNCTYTADEYISGLLMIHSYDRERHLIAGSFEFMAFSDTCNELVRVRNGKFDATYSIL